MFLKLNRKIVLTYIYYILVLVMTLLIPMFLLKDIPFTCFVFFFSLLVFTLFWIPFLKFEKVSKYYSIICSVLLVLSVIKILVFYFTTNSIENETFLFQVVGVSSSLFAQKLALFLKIMWMKYIRKNR